MNGLLPVEWSPLFHETGLIGQRKGGVTQRCSMDPVRTDLHYVFLCLAKLFGVNSSSYSVAADLFSMRTPL